MGNIVKKWPVRLFGKSAYDYKTALLAALSPRFWKGLIVLAVPFIVVCANYLELLERTGPGWAMIADVLLSVLIIGYLAVIVILRKRDI